MNLSTLIEKLQKLEKEGHGHMEVFYRHSASGDCGPVATPYVTDRADDQGPFDLDDEEYICISVGH
jgi:hypothetical protein